MSKVLFNRFLDDDKFCIAHISGESLFHISASKKLDSDLFREHGTGTVWLSH